MFPNHDLIKTDAYAMVAARAVSAFVDGVLMHFQKPDNGFVCRRAPGVRGVGG